MGFMEEPGPAGNSMRRFTQSHNLSTIKKRLLYYSLLEVVCILNMLIIGTAHRKWCVLC